MAAFVDDVRSSFDASEFCTVVSAGVGVGKTTSGLALRDSSAVSAATAALHSFLQDATAPGPPDVVAAYVQYSPGANELFTALRAVSINIPLASLALDCLTAVVRYSLNDDNPLPALEAARSIVKEVVKTRAVLVRDIFAHDQRGCAKKALNLLRLVAQCHPVLAKEVVNRFNLASDTMAPSLCTAANNFCRVPFLDLLFVLLASGDFDVANSLSTAARPVLITCLRVIADRTIEQANSNKSSFLSAKEKGKKKAKPKGAIPSYVQKIELIAATNLLLAFERHLLTLPQHSVKRSAFAYPMLELLALIAAADIPPLHVAPREVLPEHEALRKSASRLFIAIAADAKVSKMTDVIAALTHTAVSDGTGAVNFVLRVIDGQPRVAKGLLEKGTYLSEQPRLSSSWLGMAAVISACVLRLPCAIAKFADKGFFAKCLSHEDSLIRHTGITVMHAFCKVVQGDKAAMTQPEKFLPPLDHVQTYLKKYDDAYEGAQKLLVAYQELFCDDVEGKKADPIKLSVDMAGKDLVLSEDSIRAALSAAPRDALSSILRKGYFAKLIVHAAGTADKATSKRLWCLSHDILMLTGLFPSGTETEIDIYLSFLSGLDACLPECANALEKTVFMAWDMPFRLYDDAHKNVDYSTGSKNRRDRTSLLSVASIYRLRKLKASNRDGKSDQVSEHLRMILEKVLTTIIACQRLSGSGNDGDFLKDALRRMGLWPNKHVAVSTESSTEEPLLKECRVAQRLFTGTSNYPLTPYMKLIQATVLFHLHVHGGNTNPLNGSAAADIGFVWHAWRTFRETGKYNRGYDPFGGLSDDVQAKNVTGLGLGRLLDGLQDGQSKSEISTHILRLRKSLGTDDFMLSLGIALRINQDHAVRCLIARTAIDALSSIRYTDGETTASVSFLQESMLAAVSCKQTWDQRDIHHFMAFAIGTLNEWERLTARKRHVSFALALLLRLVIHEDDGTSVLSRTVLLTESKAELPPLSTLSFRSATDLSGLMKFCPALAKTVIDRISCCTVDELTPSLCSLLPLLQVVMRPDLFTDVKVAVGYDHQNVCKCVLTAVASIIEPLCNDCSENSVNVQEATRQIGEILVFSRSECGDLFVVLSAARARNDDIVLGNIWMLLENVFCREKQQELHEKISNVLVVECLTTVTEWLVRNQLQLDNVSCCAALNLFYGVLRYLRLRKIAIYSVAKDVAALEKSLTAACSNVMKSLHKSMGCCPDLETGELTVALVEGGGKTPSLSLSLPLKSVSEALGLDLVLDKAAKRCLISLNAHDGGFLMACLQRGQGASTNHLSMENETASAVATLVKAALMRLPRFGLEEEVATSLSVTEGVFSSETSVYNASLTQSDRIVRKCMEGISDTLRVNGGRKKFGLLERRTGLFAPISSQVIPLLEKRRLERTCRHMLESPTNHEKSPSPVFTSSTAPGTREDAFDPVFVLRTFLCACAEAQKAPGSAVLDIGRIAKDGVLAIVLTGIACDGEEIRALSFACLHQFSGVVGPVSGVELGSAAALYKDRKQLAFLLELLQNSLHSPMMEVLPLFAAWFRITMKVALSPTHDANKAVTFFFLRSPSVDVSDCLGLSHLLRCDSSGPEMKATRLLALDIIKHGVRSAKDVAVLKKRKVLDALLLLGGSASGYEHHVRDGVLDTLAILSRRTGFYVGHEMVFSFGIVPWLLHDAGQVDEPDHMLRRRLDVLLHICTSFAHHDERGRVAKIFSEALSALTRRFLRRPDSARSRNLLSSITNCSLAITRLEPQRRRLVFIDLSQICLKFHYSDDVAAIDMEALVYIIARQRNFDVQPETYSVLLQNALSTTGSTGGHLTSEAVLALPKAVNICMIHAFIAQSLLQKRRINPENESSTPGFCLRLANAMYNCPTVWLTIACVCILERKGMLYADLEQEADLLPALPSDIIDPAHDQRYCAVVDRLRLRVIDNLISCSSSEWATKDRIYETANGVS